jgi:isochorismate synthase
MEAPGLASAAPEMLFSSAWRSIRARGILARIDTPALDAQAFRRAIAAALAQARAAGQHEPIVMGAIPFDISEPSSLFVPARHEFLSREAVLAAGRRDVPCPRVVSARNIPEEADFKMGVRQAIANFQHSSIRKAVLSRKCEIRLSEPLDTGCVLGNLVAQNPSAYHFRLPMADGSELVGASPELLLRKEGARIETFPLAGSARRQADPQADQATAAGLQDSAKDHYEHRLVVDDIRQVLSPLCARLEIPAGPELVSTATLWHLGTPITGVLNDARLPALELACRLHPTPAVCGFPRSLARKLVDLIEPFERGVFTGIVGWCDDQGNGEWVVTIRCATVQKSLLCLFAGVGIVEASCPDAEWAETQAKLATMLNAFGLAREVSLP